MKKIFTLIAFVAALATVFSSCKPDDEIYNRKCKISKIWYLSNVGSPDEVYSYDEKGVLTSIMVDSVETYNFTYNKDKTVSNIVHVGKLYTETIDMTYTDRLVDKIVYKVNDTVRQEIKFYRDEETTRISHIEETYDKAFFEYYELMGESKMYKTFIGDPSEVSKMVKNSASKDLVLHCNKVIYYAPGDKKKYENIDSIVEVYPDLRQEITRTYTYDESSFNPFYGLPYAYAGYSGYYLNNKLLETETVKTAGYVTKQIVYTYSYEGLHFMNDKKFPRQFTKTSSENNIPRNTYILYAK